MSYQYFKEMMDPKELDQIVELAHIGELLTHISSYKALPFAKEMSLEISYQKLLEDVLHTRKALIKEGFKKGDHIALLLKNNYDFFRHFLAITSLEMVAVVMPIHFMKMDLSNVLQQTDCMAMIVNTNLYHAVVDMKLEIKVYQQDVLYDETKLELNENINPDGKACIMFTGGTTKKPKAVLLSHRNLMRGTINSCYGVNPIFYQRYYSILPFTHIFGLIRNGLAVLYTGSSIYLKEDLSELVKDLMTFKPTTLVLVPALAEMLMGLIQMKGIEITGSQVHTIICGGAHVSPKLPARYKQVGMNLYPGYGLTESSNLVSGNAFPLDRPMSVGKAYDHQMLKVVNKELWIKGENVMMSYYNDELANKEAFEDGWFKTNDLVDIDQEGYITIIGRKNHLIVMSNGEKVAPEPLELEINDIPYVKDSLISSEKGSFGEYIKVEVFFNAIVADKMNIDPSVEIHKDIQKINEQLPEYATIKKIMIRDVDFERSPSLKIIRKK